MKRGPPIDAHTHTHTHTHFSIIGYIHLCTLISGAKRVSLPEAPQNVGENFSEGASEEERRASEEGAPSSKRGEGWGREGKEITLESPQGTSRKTRTNYRDSPCTREVVLFQLNSLYQCHVTSFCETLSNIPMHNNSMCFINLFSKNLCDNRSL